MSNFFPPFLLIVFPLIMGCASFGKFYSSKPGRAIPPILVSIILLAAGIGIFISDYTSTIAFTWQPNAGQMQIIFDRSSIVMVVLGTVTLMIGAVYNAQHTSPINSVQQGLVFFAFAAAAVALTADHFLLRYAALEYAGLCVVGSMLSNSRQQDQPDWGNVATVFFNFRLGDIALLTAILVLQAESGTFAISPSIEAGMQARYILRLVASLGLLVAAWVKLAIWPLDRWVQAAKHLPPTLRTWYVDVLMPALGAYLFYRVSPLLQTVDHLPSMIIVMSILSLLAKVFVAHVSRERIPLNHLLNDLSTICLLSLGLSGNQNALWVYMIYWLIARMLFSFFTTKFEHSPPARPICRLCFSFSTSLSILAFSFLALLFITRQNSINALLVLSLWILVWVLLVIVRKSNSPDRSSLSNQTPHLSIRAYSLSFLSGLFMSLLVTSVISMVLFALTQVIKPQGIRIVSKDVLNLEALRFASFSFIIALLLDRIKAPQTWLDSLRVKEGNNYHLVKNSREKRNQDMSPISPARRDDIPSRFIKAANIVYRVVEQDSVERIALFFLNIFKFLFETVEQFASRELWEKALKMITRISRRIQAWNPGLLRLNSLWFLLFIILLLLVLLNDGILHFLPID